jgi:hypothetical protein
LTKVAWLRPIAPRLFALFREEGERAGGHIFARGLQFKDHAEVVRECGTYHSCFPLADSTREKLSRHGKMRLVWYNPDAATPRTRQPDIP